MPPTTTSQHHHHRHPHLCLSAVQQARPHCIGWHKLVVYTGLCISDHCWGMCTHTCSCSNPESQPCYQTAAWRACNSMQVSASSWEDLSCVTSSHWFLLTLKQTSSQVTYSILLGPFHPSTKNLIRLVLLAALQNSFLHWWILWCSWTGSQIMRVSLWSSGSPAPDAFLQLLSCKCVRLWLTDTDVDDNDDDVDL